MSTIPRAQDASQPTSCVDGEKWGSVSMVMSRSPNTHRCKTPYTVLLLSEVTPASEVELLPGNLTNPPDPSHLENLPISTQPNILYHSLAGMTSFEALYGRLPPNIPNYVLNGFHNKTVDHALKSRDAILCELKENIQRRNNE
ncbi:hypothetical protein QN277_019549 [Acacia crassicarpa]|uniref:Uncharacterized protein n=1 Tax=Acacia crassicarpa TaxID=499986 RepID=A0AAE1JMJ0_9FABA|nr:hypothetical protein QN277_019549 [Acacia crassicarpa]